MIDITDVSLYKMPRSFSEMESANALLDATNKSLISANQQLKESNDRLKVALVFSSILCFIAVLGLQRGNPTEVSKRLLKDIKKRS